MPNLAEAKQIAQDIEAFRQSSERFSECNPNLIERYGDQWIAVYQGEVIAAAKSIGELTSAVEQQGKPLAQIMVRYLSRRPRKYIL